MVVRPGQGDVAQARGLEAVAVALHAGLCPASVVGVGQAGLRVHLAVLEVVGTLAHHLVGESAHVHAGVTGGALVVLEQGVAFHLLGGEGLLVSLEVTVEGGVGREQSLLVFGDGVRDGLLVQAFGIDLIEALREGGVFRKAGGDFLERGGAHLDRIEGRTSGLVGQGGGAAVPELDEVEHGVVGSRRVDAAELSADAVGVLVVVHTGGLNGVAGGTGDGTVARQAGVVVELLAQLYLVGIHGHTVGNGTDGLVLEGFGRQLVGIELRAVLLHPVQGDAGLGTGERCPPVGHGVRSEGHGAVHHAFLHFGQVHLVDGLVMGNCLHHGSDVEGLVALGHVAGDERLGHWKLGVERQFGTGGVARSATAFVQNLCHLLVYGQ